MTPTTAVDPGAERCALCKKKAVHHRLTARGALYCLELAHHAHVRWHHAIELDPGVVYRVPVGQLRAGVFPDGVGATLASMVRR